MLILNDTSHSSYLLHENNIYEIVYKDASRAAVEEESATVSLLNTIAQALRLLGITIKNFPRTEREQAEHWLLEGRRNK